MKVSSLEKKILDVSTLISTSQYNTDKKKIWRRKLVNLSTKFLILYDSKTSDIKKKYFTTSYYKFTSNILDDAR